ncbi:MAG: cytochrome peroxidase [Flavipsychrobacter sp.]|jgi:cytochrome c peroxidase|nr:cytochrome peroxidase [Flavipsychrobacter sp.]
MKSWVIIAIVGFACSFFSLKPAPTPYENFYARSLSAFEKEQQTLLDAINETPIPDGKDEIIIRIRQLRRKLKASDFWLRYFEPVAYKKINGPLPVEWENEVFEKFEKPYKREGAGLTLAELYMEEPGFTKDSLAHLIQLSINAIAPYRADSITSQLSTYHHFFLCNRLYLLNLAAIYTTAFDCPEPGNVIFELRNILHNVRDIYTFYDQSFPDKPISKEYLELYNKTISFADRQPANFTQFNHFTFIKDYINPLFALNQQMIQQYKVQSISFNDYTLNNSTNSIFDKSLYAPQNTKGIYSLVEDPTTLAEIRAVGKLLFYDPILSGNNMRSCASCHKPKEYFTDTVAATSPAFDRSSRLPRNTPSLINSVFNHLIMLDGKHISLQGQGKDVITNPKEMGSTEKDVIEKVMSCREYKTAFKKFLKLTPEEHNVTLNHIVSAITFYYRDFSNYYSPFDEAMNNNKPLQPDAVHGFNLFMSKAQCGTCHFVPQFNGVHPPYVGSEFEVLGTPADKAFTKLSEDRGRFEVNPAFETLNAFRTGTVRNAEFTKPYMHNGVFNTIEEVIDFYDAGGAAGRKFSISNQTLATDSLQLTATEKKQLISFIHSLNENILFESTPGKLPVSSIKELNNRKVGGEY